MITRKEVRRTIAISASGVIVALLIGLSVFQAFAAQRGGIPANQQEDIANDSARMIEEGRNTFRLDTMGDETFWGGTLKLHEAIKGEKLGGVGPGVSPKTALAVGLKVDSEALPADLKDALARGEVDLDDPATTVALLKLEAVVGVKGGFDDDGNLNTVGITCALCHSRVDDSFAPGIGKRIDGWSNQDLNVGAIISLAPNLEPIAAHLDTDVATVKKVLAAWGPGKFDAELLLDGKGFRPDGKSAATLIPPAFGFSGVNLHTWTGWGSVTYWNAFVANIEMGGQGTFFDPRLDDADKFPFAAKAKLGHIRHDPDLVSPKLPALHYYQLSIAAPSPPEGSFDVTAAARGADVFNGKAKCASCHVEPKWTEPGWDLHKASEIGIDDFQALRSPDERYRTASLGGLWTHMARGFYHDGRFATLLDVVNHYDKFFKLGLADQEKNDLVEYLKSIPSPEG